MPATEPQRTPEDVSRLGTEVFDRQVRPLLGPEDDGKFVAIDVESGDHELNEDDYTAVMHLRSRRPSAEIWLMQAGYPTTGRIGAVQ